MPKSKTYSLYLIKQDVTNFEDIFSEEAVKRIKTGNVVRLDSSKLGDKASVYLFENIPIPPNWLSDVSSVFQNVPDIRNKSSSGVVIFKHVDRVFASTYAHGWQFIDDTKIETDFGLRVAINSLNDSKNSINMLENNYTARRFVSNIGYILKYAGHVGQPIGSCLLYTSPSPRDRG